MTVPAALPALAILAGTAAACLLHVSPYWPAAACLAAFAGVVCAFVFRRPVVLAVSAAVCFAGGSWALADRTFREAEEPPIRTALAGRLPSAFPVSVTGRLRADATNGLGSVLLDIDLDAVDGVPHASGGVRLGVSGALAAGLSRAWRAGRTVRAPALLREPARLRDPGVADARLDLARRGIALVGSIKSGALVEVTARGSWLDERAADLRAFTRAAINHHVGRWSRRSAGIVVAILIGDRAGLDDEVQQRLREAGTYHVIAISGGNMAILAAVLMVLLRAARVPLRAACWLTIAVLAAYASAVGGGASVVRATLMAGAFLAARQADHRGPPMNALAVAAGVILAATPTAVCDVAVALTFGATIGILTGVGQASSLSRVRPWLRPAAALLAASVSAELALFPVGVLAFSRVTFAGLILNFAAIPLMSVAQVAGMAVLPLAACGAERLAAVAGWIAHAGANGLVESASLLDVAPWLSWRLPPPPVVVVAAYYLAWCGWFVVTAKLASAAPGRALGAARRGCVAAVVVSGLWILTAPPLGSLVARLESRATGEPPVLRATVLDVGHADCVLLQLPDGRSLLVDAAGSMAGSSFDIGGRVVAPALWALGLRRLDALVISHGDPDHVGGAASVLRDFRPREVWEGVPVPSSVPMTTLKALALRQGAGWRERRAGETIPFDDVSIRVWHPPDPDWERRKVRNDDSLVLEVRYGRVSLVLPGDIGAGVERALAPSLDSGRLGILKVAHHGSATSSSREFLAAMHPAVAIVSAASTTKVPDDVLARYRDIGAAVFRTNDDGAITVTTDGRTATVTTFTGRRVVIDRTTKNTKDTETTTKTVTGSLGQWEVSPR